MTKKFIEFINELKTSTYYSAATKAEKEGHSKRSARFREHAWKQHLKDKVKKYGLFTFNNGIYEIKNPKFGQNRYASEKLKKSSPIEPHYFYSCDMDMLEEWDGSWNPVIPAYFSVKPDDVQTFNPFCMEFDFETDSITIIGYGFGCEVGADGKTTQHCNEDIPCLFDRKGCARKFKRMLLDEADDIFKDFISDPNYTEPIRQFCGLNPEEFVERLIQMIRRLPIDVLYKD